MKLYSRQLNSIEELRKEKQKLKARIKDTDLVPSFKGAGADNVKDREETGEGAADIIGTITNALGSLPLMEILGTAGPTALSFAARKIQKKAIMRLVKEVAGGYVKWKAVELGYKAVKSYAKARKNKKAAEKAARL